MTETTLGPAVLLVEDSPSQGIRFQTILEANQCRVHWATSGLAGVAEAEARRFDLIILDIELPDITGFEVCQRLKMNESLADIPVIMLTTRDGREDVLAGLGEGAIDYIPKDPFAEMVLIETMQQMGLLAAG